MRLRKLSAILLFCLCSIPRARAEATLFLGEPYGYDGALAGTGHAAVYLSRVCATSPVVLRLCAPDETGVVLSRYRGIAGYDWIAIPLIPYLYAVERQEDVPLFVDAKLLAFLRDRYRRDHLESLVPDLPDGGTPGGVWYELIGASYIRTIYAFEIKTSPEQDAALIRKLNNRPNRQRWTLITANCADFARGVIDFYHPHAVHRSIVADLGVTTPKQLARTLSSYTRRHPELRTSRPSSYAIPQVPGTVPRSRPAHTVTECALTAKKYMLPLFAVHPYIAGALLAGYVGHGHFNPSRNALILDSKQQLDESLTRMDRRTVRTNCRNCFGPRLRQTLPRATMTPTGCSCTPRPNRSSSFRRTQAAKVRQGGEVTPVGIARANILSVPEGFEFAAGLVQARLREELKPAAARKTARADVASDLVLLRQLLARQPGELASTAGAATAAALTPQPAAQ